MLTAGALMFPAPWALASVFTLPIAPAWGLGNFAFAFCAAGSLIGMLLGRRMKF
ncbi:hypothetical protein [Dyella amyloliquefaciens]|uniref:hypothetical protein n=1 Tax=Dyella amyloliquefaciens TaxID=1770545 RepID=UPI0013EECF4B|nr:hypothetical protein [Dyella amyloliquefaciens]